MKKITLIILILMIPFALEAQFKGGGDMDAGMKMQEELEKKLGAQDILKGETLPAGNKVIPEKYLVGPGDYIAVQIMPYQPMETVLQITPDNSLIIPRIGQIQVSGKTLAEVADTLNHIITQRNSSAEVNVSLKIARLCLVTIDGNVIFPGTYSLPASYRVSTAIQFANQINTEKVSPQQIPALLNKQQNKRQRDRLYSNSGMANGAVYASRNIKVFHKDGSSQIADIERAIATNDVGYDPYIREGDNIEVPFEAMNYPLISISGEVMRPRVVVFKKGDMASALLKMGSGLTENADPGSAMLIQPDGSKLPLKIDSRMNLFGDDHALRPGSVIIVDALPQPEPVDQGVVSVTGEVGHPGVFLIENDQTRLKEIIELAGGFTDDAYLAGAYIIRRDDIQNQITDPRNQVLEKFQYSDLTMEDTSRFQIDILMREPLVSCDFVQLFEEGMDEFNVLLDDGDVIVVPAHPGKVFVFGQVNQPGYVEFRPEKSMQWYIDRAGGFAQGAEEDRARIIRGKTKVWVEGGEEIAVFDGDEIYVPRPPDIPINVETQKWGLYSGLIGSAAGLIGLLFTIFSR
ncbi:MAG: SLBB domain-containing protein [Bacteroidota bacterium]